MQIHIVKKAESLWTLSQQYRIGMDQIIQVNHLETSEELIVGQALLIPIPVLLQENP